MHLICQRQQTALDTSAWSLSACLCVRNTTPPPHQSNPRALPWLPLLQAEELQRVRTAAEDATAQAASLTQLVSSLQAEKASLAQQIKKLTAEKASLSEQLGSSAGDIDMLQVCAFALPAVCADSVVCALKLLLVSNSALVPHAHLQCLHGTVGTTTCTSCC
jgi:hypothetical protein